MRFTIIPTSVGKQLESDNMFSSRSIEARRMMAAFGLSDKQIRKFMHHRVTPANIDGLLLMMQQLSDDLASGRKKARSRVAVAYDEIDRFLNPQVAEEVTPAEEIPAAGDEPAAEAIPQSPDIVTW